MLTVLAASGAFSLGGALMKWSGGFTRVWPSIGVALLFVIGSGLLARAVMDSGLSSAYVAGLGAEVVFSIALGVFVFGERLSPQQLGGLVLIVAGIAAVRFA